MLPVTSSKATTDSRAPVPLYNKYAHHEASERAHLTLECQEDNMVLIDPFFSLEKLIKLVEEREQFLHSQEPDVPYRL